MILIYDIQFMTDLLECNSIKEEQCGQQVWSTIYMSSEWTVISVQDITALFGLHTAHPKFTW